MPTLDRGRIDSLFMEQKDINQEHDMPVLSLHTYQEISDKVRKRVLISSDYRSAFKVKSILEVYIELN